jgi:hypothetical protein
MKARINVEMVGSYIHSSVTILRFSALCQQIYNNLVVGAPLPLDHRRREIKQSMASPLGECVAASLQEAIN